MKLNVRTFGSSSLVCIAALVLAACSGQGGADTSSTSSQPEAPASSPKEAAPATPWQGTALIKPAYPDEGESKGMNLDYETYQFEGSGLSVTPLPPYLAKSVELDLEKNAGGYTVKAGGPQCAFKLKVAIGAAAPKILDPKTQETMQVVAEDFGEASSIRLALSLDEGAENNWSCGILIEPGA